MVGGLGRSRSVATVGVTAAAVLVACGGASVAVGATAPASTTLVSVSSAGVQGNRASAGNNEAGAQLSANGRYVVFVSAASNLVPHDTNGRLDVFVRDRQAGTTRRVSVSSGGAQAAGRPSRGASISADGRWVVFSSSASNLVPHDTNDAQDAFVHDLQNGITRRVSVNSRGKQGTGGGAVCLCAVSAHGRYVAFSSISPNMVRGDTNGEVDVFVRDLRTGSTRRVSVRSGGGQVNSGSLDPAMSAGGRYVAFTSRAPTLDGVDTNALDDVFVHDRQTNTTSRVSVSSAGRPGERGGFGPSMSADGRYVAFVSSSPDLVPGDTTDFNAFVHDTLTGTTEMAGPAGTVQAEISPDGRYVAEAGVLWDRQTATSETVAVSDSGQVANSYVLTGAVSTGGRYVVFSSPATNLVPDDTTRQIDVFVRDRGT
jgi:Tol biopolymer transport system component